MILSKEQINRYLRHIIMPEISGQGQKKLLESKVYIYGENVKELISLVLYLSAMGIGTIYCSLKDEKGYEKLFFEVKDLNNDVKIGLINDSTLEPDFIVVQGSSKYVNKTVKSFKHIFVPTIVSVINQWKALFKTFNKSSDLLEFIELLNENDNSSALPFVSSLTGAISSLGVVKLCLNLGNTCDNILSVDIFNMEFVYYNNRETAQAVDSLIKTENTCYDELNKKLSEAKVLIIGAGGLGSPVLLGLSMAGIGTLGLVDSDKVELSNLNRQVLHSISRIGIPKAESAKFFLMKINPKLNINTYVEDLTENNVNEIIADYDLVVSAVDNIQTRYLINDSCYFMKKAVIEAGVLRFDGTNTTIIPDKGHCYRCLYPNLGSSGMSCSETGVLGAVPGVMGFIQAAEAFKVITGVGKTLKNKILLFDGLEMEFNIIDLEKNPECPLCGENSKMALDNSNLNCLG